MGCGCNTGDHDATAVLTCLACPHARPSEFVSCAVRGKPIVKQVCGGLLKSEAARPFTITDHNGVAHEYTACPRGPDEHGRTRWAGLLWRGVAWPLRLVMADDVLAGWLLSLPRPAALDDFPGCGCLDRLKGWTERAGAVADKWHGSAIMRTASIAIAILATLALLYLTGARAKAQTNPNWQERTMLTLVNACRMAPTEYRDVYLPGAGNILEQYPAVDPLRAADGLNASARFHCLDMASRGCFWHNDCPPSTRTWAERIGTFWPGWSLLGENIAGGFVGPVQAVGGLIADPVNGAPAPDRSGYDGHRWNIMYANYTHVGNGFAMSETAAYRRYYTQDFGRPLALAAPDDPASPIVDGSNIVVSGEVWLLCNIFDPEGMEPQSIVAVVDGVHEAMTLHMGEPAAGTYRLVVGDRTSGCHVYSFRAVDAWGTSWRYPASGNLAFGCVDDLVAPADFNADGTVSMADIFDFLAAWLDGSARADFDENGTLAEADIFAFLNEWIGA